MTRDHYIELFDIYWPIGVAIGLLVALATLFAAWRYRAGRVGDRWPRQGKDSNTPLELGYAAVLACIVALLTYFTFSTMSEYEEADAAPAEEQIEVTAAKWNWRFDYPEYGITSQGTPDRRATLTVPLGRRIRFRQTSLDVIHSFFIPYMRFKRDAFPGRTTSWTMVFDEESAGRHRRWGECAEFCGAYHSYMEFDVDVLPPDEFRRWVQEQRP